MAHALTLVLVLRLEAIPVEIILIPVVLVVVLEVAQMAVVVTIAVTCAKVVAKDVPVVVKVLATDNALVRVLPVALVAVKMDVMIGVPLVAKVRVDKL